MDEGPNGAGDILANTRNFKKGNLGSMGQGLNYRLIQASLVLMADDVNAGGINQDYLASKGIVPQEWAWEISKNTVATPIASVVTYSNGTNILASVGRVQTAHDEDGFDPSETKLDFITDKYVRANPDLHYSIIGINFHVAFFDPDPQKFLRATVIREAFMEGLGFDEVRVAEVVSNRDDKIFSVNLNPGTALEEDGEKGEIILVRGNFERRCNGYPASEQVCEFVSKFKDDWEEFQAIIEKIFIRE